MHGKSYKIFFGIANRLLKFAMVKKCVHGMAKVVVVQGKNYIIGMTKAMKSFLHGKPMLNNIYF